MTPALFQFIDQLMATKDPAELDALISIAEAKGIAPPTDYPDIALEMFKQPPARDASQRNIAQKKAVNPEMSSMPPGPEMAFPIARNAR